MSATSISSTSVSINCSSSSSSNNSGSNNVLSSASNIVILENQILDSNDVVAAAGLQQLSNAGTIKLTRDCAVQYSNLINSYGNANSSSGSSSTNSNNGSIVTNSNTINIIPGDASQTSSRVQVLSNVQLVSKGGSQPSTFSYVDASGKNFNVLTSSGKISTNKLISVPITKVKTFNHLGQQPQQQSPQTQIVSSQIQPHHPVQKVTVPRSIQLVTRIPNSTISVSNGRVSQIAPAMAPQQQQQPQFSIQQFTDSGAVISSSSLDMKNAAAQGPTTTTIPPVIGNKSVAVKGKATTASSLKVLQNATMTPGPKTSVSKGMSVSLKSVRNNSKNSLSGINSQYFVKNSTNGTVQQQPSGTTTSIYTTSPAQAVYHNPTPHPPQQPMQVPIGTVTAPSGKGASTSMGTFDSSSSAGHNTHEHPVPSVTVTGYTSSTGKGKKYGAIANSESIASQSYGAATTVKVKSVARGRNNSLSANYQPLESGSYQRYSASPSRQQQQSQFSSSPQSGSSSLQQQQHQTTITTSRDDHLFINGQQMTDETSARILQSLSQKSLTEGNSSSAGKYSNYRPQQQFTFYGSDSVPQLTQNNVPAAFLPGGIGTNISSSSTNSTSSTTPSGIVYDPSDARFYEDKPDSRRTSTSETITYSSENIPLREGFPAHYSYNYREDDDQIGVEVRPAPVDTSNGRFHILQAVMQDHTYFAVLPDLKPPELPPVPHPSAATQQQPQQQQSAVLSLPQYTLQSKRKSSSPAPAVIAASASPVSALVPPVPASTPILPVAIPAPLTQMSLSNMATITSSSSGSSSAVAGSISPSPAVAVPTVATPQPVIGSSSNAGLDYIYQARPQDDDANSVISTGSRNFNTMDNDLGEETETAPEGEGEDDSVTRCICDLTHDDGYMICCDKCSAWQHVDCMGIDRLNIPDEYNCEMCQPRAVDKNRARLLQMEKRKEQSLFLSNNNLQQMQLTEADVTSTNLINVPSVAIGAASVSSTGSGGKGANQYTTGKAVAGSKKNKASSSSKKKAADGGPSTKKTSKKAAENALNRVNGKRKELKKPSKKKVKTAEQNAEKMSNMIRTWIDNYERAITNHYSPELRARLQAFGKMQSHNPLLNVDRLIPAAAVSNLMQKCTTVPHAGGKILISTGDIEPKTPIIEIRGKYMISSQHKQLQSLFNMAANGKLGNNKNAGPFLFLYQLTNGGMELCVDTRTYGNDARFVRRSCRPNAEILHNVDKGVVHLYIVSTVNIKANTEITIKHDEQLIQRVGGVVILTHTTVTNICACGLIKECQYSAQLSDGLLPTTSGISSVATGPAGALTAGGVTQPSSSAHGVSSSSTVNTTTNTSKPSKSKKNNGALGEAAEKKPAKKRNSRSTGSNAESRLRSISSSGDSTNEMMLYIQQQSPAPHQLPNAHSTSWNQQLQHQSSRQPHPSAGIATGGLNLTMPANVQPPQQQQQQMTLGQLPPHDISPLPCNEEMVMSTSGQFLQHHLHQWQQQHPNLGNLVHAHGQSPQSQQQASHQPPPVHPPQTPPPMSPVMGLNSRPGFYTEIKSPINSPPLCFSGGPPPPLAVPTVNSPVKSILQSQPPQPMAVTKANPIETHQPTSEVSLPAPEHHALAEEQSRLELIHQQQQLHQQQIMEDILKIKIKSPAASPVKQEPPMLSPTTCSNSSMLSPPPPPPISITQRLLCAETLKNELFHSHFNQQQQSQHVASAPVTQTTVLPPVISPQHKQPTLLKSPVKIEYPQHHPSPGREIKQEAHPECPAGGALELKTEHEIKTEPTQVVAPLVPAVEDVPKIKKEEQPEPPAKASRPSTPVQLEDSVKKEDPLLSTSTLCDSVPSSPVKNHTSSTMAGCNSSNSSPLVTQQQGSGSSNKKKSSASKDNSVSHSAVAPAKEEKKPSRKLTREERKMEAIVKAFEKMEQSQQRKQELKEQRKEGKRRSVSSSTPDESIPSGSSSAKKRSLSSSQKRKKKKSKSLSQHFGSPTQSRKKKSMSKSSKSSKKSSPEHHGGHGRPYESKAAELLLTFSQSAEKPSQSTYFGDDVKPLGPSEPRESTMSSNLPLLSSACMLVEAAVGPLEQQQQSSSTTPGPQEQDFKFPHKAKTKKSMSREWLSGQVDVPFRRVTPDQDSGYMSEEKSQDFRRTTSEGLMTPLGVDVSEAAATNNICIAAKKVEEFIAQNSPQSDEITTSGGVGGTPAKWDDKLPSSNSNTSLGVAGGASESNQTQTSCVPESAAAKKRWLRQAISEETDEQNQASSSPPPPNGFTTPLKKRRVIRTPEDASNQQHQSNHLGLLAQQQQQPPLLLAAAQKIDFGGPPPSEQPQIVTVLTQSGYSVERGNSYWSNSVAPAPLPYSSSPVMVAEEKHAIDLSRTAPVTLRLPPPRIAPYKIVPIAQALTPLHFTDDPEPLPVVAPPPTAPVVSHELPQLHTHHHHHHVGVPPSETVETDFSRQIAPVPEIPQRMNYEPPCLAPPPSAVAAVVPASLMPPEQPLYPPVNYHRPEGDDTTTVIRNSLPPPRSKGSQKYIGSPAKFEPTSSPAESQSSSVATPAETPEKHSSVASSSCSDVEEEDTALPTAPAAVELQQQPIKPKYPTIAAATEPSSSEVVVEKEIDAGRAEDKGVTSEVAPVLMQQVPQATFVQEEEVVESEDVAEQVVEPMDTYESTTILASGVEPSAARDVVSSKQSLATTGAAEPRSTVKSDAVNGREKQSKKSAPREECENNELEDLQKVIASFHTENIMTLISRNKKAKKAGRDSDERPSKSSTRKQSRNKQNASTTKVAEVAPSVVSDAVPQPTAELAVPTVPEEEVSDPTNIAVEASVVPSATTLAPHMPAEEIPSISTLGRSYSHPSWSSTTADTFRMVTSEARMRPDIPQINYNSPSTYQSNAARNLLSSLSVGSEPLSTLGVYRPSTSSFLDYPKATSGTAATATSSGNSSIYQYRPSTEISSLLEKGFSSGARPSSFLDDRSRTDRVTSISTERTVSSSSFLLSASKTTTDNLSTLGSTVSSYPKIFTKTASHDPRLNPALTTPEPATPITPKRKLSINEYRQRKMQSSSASSAPSTPAPASSSTEVATCSNSIVTTSSDSNAISSSLGSNDVSSSISKELSLELEMELNESSEVEAGPAATSDLEISGSKTTAATDGSAELNSSEQTV